MDTKYQNKNSIGAAGIVRLFLLFAALMLIAAGAAVSCEGNVRFDSYFYASENIKTEAVKYAKKLQRYYIYFGKFDPSEAKLKIAAIDDYLSRTRAVVSDTEADERSYYAVDRFYENDNETDDDADVKSLFSKYPDPTELYDFNIEDLDALTVGEITNRETELTEMLQNYYSVKNYLDTTQHFHYYIYSASPHRLIATNADNLYTEKVYDSISVGDDIFCEELPGSKTTVSGSFVKNGMECTLSIPVDSDSSFVNNEVTSIKRLIGVNKILADPAASLLLILAGMLLFVIVFLSGRSAVSGINRAVFSAYRRLPLILKLMLSAGVVFIYASMYERDCFISRFIAYSRCDSLVSVLAAAFISLLVLVLTAENIFMLVREPKRIADERDVAFAVLSIRNFRFALKTKSYLLIFIYISVLVIFLSGVIGMLICLPYALKSLKGMLEYLFCFFPVVITALVIKLINVHIKLCWYIKEMSLGNIEEIPVQRGLFTAPLNSLNNINDGVKRTMDEAIKNERLKSELITNVSHDLKTPLTSIISYVNLLKELKLDSKAAADYIDVIENKAMRLKILIDDLFEASKLASGQMRLEKQPSDVVALLKQTMGELDYKIEESGIEFRTDLPDNPVILNIDGQKMWRVFDNLLNNILKYSPSGSRAYIDISGDEYKTAITFKNVSAYPLNFDTGELFERFKRGDAARATEGSGLGLSIAKSIVDLHGGSMRIVTDGDLFKVIIELFRQS